MSQPPSNPQPSPFSKLPLELLLRATAGLSTADLCSLRLTCRSIENALHHSFAREFFTKKQFMLTYPSLQALLDISASRLGVCLEHVIIGLDHYNSPVFHNSPTTTDTERAKMSKYILGHDHQRALLDSGEAVDLLGRAFAHLPGLRVVGIRDYASAARDGRDPGTRWQSYGATTVRLDTGINLLDANASRVYAARTDQGRVREYVTQVFRTVLLALGSISATKVLPTSIEVLRHDFGYLVPGAFLVPASQKPRILPVLSKIETIFLPIRLASNTPNMNPPNSGAMSDHHIRVFLSYMPNLRHLRINMGFGDLLNLRFLRWLGEPVDANASSQVNAPSLVNHNGEVNNNGQIHQAQVDPIYGLPLPAEPVTFPHLEELNLGFCFIEPDALLAIISKFAPTLRRLELWKLTLAPFMDMANRPFNNTGPACIWPAFLKRLRDIPGLDLRHLMIGEPSQDCVMTPYGPQVEAVQFKSLDEGPPQSFRVTQKRSYTGIDWRHFVKDLEQDMHVIRVASNDSGDSDEDMDSDDDNDDDDDDDSEDDDGM